MLWWWVYGNGLERFSGACEVVAVALEGEKETFEGIGRTSGIRKEERSVEVRVVMTVV